MYLVYYTIINYSNVFHEGMDVFLPVSTGLNIDELIKYYFQLRLKFKYIDICNIINEHHHITLTLRQLKAKLKKLNLTRKRNISEEDLMTIISNELGTSLANVGYRQMTEFISLKYGANIAKENVKKALLILDPEEVERKKHKVIKRRVYESCGPMNTFHIDGNDKLKRFGFPIYGCIDGFSRKLMQLIVLTSNNDPLVIANHFLFCIKKHRVPHVLQMDCRAENIYFEDMQVFFTGSEESFIYAESIRNQRIESFWSRLKKYKLNCWINFFKYMINADLHKPSSAIHREVLVSSFIPVIQAELNEFMRTWNCRNIRKSAEAPGGVPEILFNVPAIVGFPKKGTNVSERDIQIAEETLGIAQYPTYFNKDIYELIICYTRINKLTIPRDSEKSLSFYINILECFEKDGFPV